MSNQETINQLIREGQISNPSSARGRLLNAAAALFREKGFERTTVRDLAAEVGIQSGSLFHHFASKEAILKAVMEETIILNTVLMRRALEACGSPREKLMALIRCELESVNGQTGEAMAVLVYEWRSLSATSQKQILALRDVYEGLWLEVLQELYESGDLHSDPFITRRMLTGALSWTVTWFRPEGPLDLSDLAKEVVQMLGLSVTR